METTGRSELAMDHHVEITADSPESKDFSVHEQGCLETYPPPSLEEKETLDTLLTDLENDEIESNKPDCSETSVYSGLPCQSPKEDLLSDVRHEVLNRNESITSSVSDTPSSADSVYENEANRKKQGSPEQDLEPEQCLEKQQDPEPQHNCETEQDPVLREHQDPEQYYDPLQDPELGVHPEPEQYCDPLQDPELGVQPEPEQYCDPLQDPQLGVQPEPEQYCDPLQDPQLGVQPEPEQYCDPLQDPQLGVQPEPEQYCDPLQDPQLGVQPEPEQYCDPLQDPQLGVQPEPEQYCEPEQNPKLGVELEPEQDTQTEKTPLAEQQPELEQYSELNLCPEPEMKDNDLNPQDDGYQNLAADAKKDPDAHEILFEPQNTEESVLEQCIKEEAISDVSSDSCHGQDPDEMDECLRVEIAAASSDSDSDEKWRAIFSSSINKEDDDSYLDSLQLSAQGLFVQKVDVTDFEQEDDSNHCEEVQLDVPQVEEVLEQPEDTFSFPKLTQEVKYVPLGLQGLSKISEDDSENGKDANHNDTTHQQISSHMSTSKKLPKDFCVIQETKSENVSTEHVDFQLARKQWREMEAQNKNKIIIPTTKQPNFHGSHSFMYTPVRNIERINKKSNDLESLNLVGDYPHTQFSPCSEDSGLDDSSYRSPYEDPETPVEKEIRLSLEREENFRRERGFSKMGKSTDCAPSRGIPRSISTPLTPSFIITSSPTKEPLRHEVSANVIILDPSNGKDKVSPRSGEWHSEDNSSSLIILETSNLIIRSASEFSLNKAGEQPQEKMFLNNPFFKLRSRSTMSLVDEEIKMVKQREEELRQERANLYDKGRFSAERMMSNHMDTLAFGNSVDIPVKCKSSPSSPMKQACRMDRSVLSCDHRFPEAFTGGRRKSAMALRWEAGEFSKHDD